MNFKDFWHADTEAEIRKNHLYVFLSRRYRLELVEDPDVLFFSCFGREFLEYDCLRVFYTGENYRPDLGVSDYAISFDYIDDPRHYRLPFYMLSPGIAGLTDEKDPEAILASKTLFCNFIYSNSRCKVRNEFFRKLSRYRPVDSAGKFLNNTGALLEDTHGGLSSEAVPEGGWSDDVKIRFQQQCKFSIAFENSSWPGYTTEKLVDAMLANTVPIYWGDPEVTRDFNPGSFINCHDYDGLDEVVDVVRALDTDDELYKSYLAEPWLTEDAVGGSLDEDRFFEWFDRAMDDRGPVRDWHQGVASRLASLAYLIKRRHWWIRKFGRLSHVWALYRRM